MQLFCHNYGMAVRTTIDIPEPLHQMLSERAKMLGTSIRALIVRAIEDTYLQPRPGELVTAPFITGSGNLGPAFPKDENPHDLVFS
jgi:hypothetical protein